MKIVQKIIPIAFALALCLFFVVSVIDTNETRQSTNFNQSKIMTHLDKLTENGPRSIANTDANALALEYIASTLQSYGVVNEDTTDHPAYVRQEFIAEDTEYQNWYLQNIIVHIPANAADATDEAILFMGHTDSVPMGNGASDDGVACAVMLEAIRYYLDKMESGYTLKNDLVFCFANGEEYGMYGSEAFMEEFVGFDMVVDRIKFGTNLESRGTSGTLIMFETAKNNYNTVKLFAEVNRSVFTCSIATMVYDMMPNYTDFTNFKDAYQGLNMANILGGENYHTQNDDYAHIGSSYLSQQAQIVDALIDKLSNYTLSNLYNADESAIFFSYLNLTTVVYNHTATIVIGILGILLLIANILLSSLYRKQHNLRNTALSILAIMIGLIVTAVVCYLCYYLFQYVAVLFGVIDLYMIGTITYSNPAIVIGIGILALALTALTAYLCEKWFKISARDLTRAFAYIHVFLGIVLSFVLADASYLFIFSGILLMLNELLITLCRKTDFAAYHGELLATALYFPIVIPVIVLATSALGLTMAYVYGLVFALSIFAVGICIAPLCKYCSIRSLVRLFRKKACAVSPAEGALHILAVALVIFLCVSISTPNANVNLQGKQNIAKLPYDDALVYVVDDGGEHEYRIYDLNAYRALKRYAPEMEYADSYYVGEGDEQAIAHSIISTVENGVLKIEKTDPSSLVYLDFANVSADTFTIDDGVTSKTYSFNSLATFDMTIHTNCTVTINGGTADISYLEVVRDYAALIPDAYAGDDERLHFNLWLTDCFVLGQSE